MPTLWLISVDNQDKIPDNLWGAYGTNFSDIDVLTVDELFRRYGAHNQDGIRDFRAPQDIWNYKVFVACLDKAKDTKDNPDVYEIANTWTQALAGKHALDITELASDIDAVSTFQTHARLTCRGEHWTALAYRYHSLPFTCDVRMLFFNKERFSAGDFQNLEQFRRKLLHLKENGLHKQFAIATEQDAFHFLLPFLWSFNGGIVQPFSLRRMAKSRETRAALLGVTSLFLDDLAQSAKSPKEAHEMLRDGRVGVAMGGWDLVSSANSGVLQNVDVTIAPPNMWKACFVGGTNLAISPKYGPYLRDQGYANSRALLVYLTLDQALFADYGFKSLLETPAHQFNRSVGKIPPQLRIWREWQREDIESGHQWTASFADGLTCSHDFRLPSCPEFALVEHDLKVVFRRYWKQVQGICDERNPRLHARIAKLIDDTLDNSGCESENDSADQVITKYMAQSAVSVHVFTRDANPDDDEFKFQGELFVEDAREKYGLENHERNFDVLIDEVNMRIYTRENRAGFKIDSLQGDERRFLKSLLIDRHNRVSLKSLKYEDLRKFGDKVDSLAAQIEEYDIFSARKASNFDLCRAKLAEIKQMTSDLQITASKLALERKAVRDLIGMLQRDGVDIIEMSKEDKSTPWRTDVRLRKNISICAFLKMDSSGRQRVMQPATKRASTTARPATPTNK